MALMVGNRCRAHTRSTELVEAGKGAIVDLIELDVASLFVSDGSGDNGHRHAKA